MGCLLRGTWGQRRLPFLVFEDERDVSILKPGRKEPHERAPLEMQEAEWDCWVEGSGPWVQVVGLLQPRRPTSLPDDRTKGEGGRAPAARVGAPSRVERVLGLQTGLLLERGGWSADGAVADCLRPEAGEQERA